MNGKAARTAVSLLDAGEEDFALATMVESRGASPRHVGASMQTD